MAHLEVTVQDSLKVSRRRIEAPAALTYQRGFGQEYQSEAIPGALPRRNNPLSPPMGLYSELINTTAFMAPREHSRRSYVFRLRPSAFHGPLRQCGAHLFRNFLTAPLPGAISPNPMRWAPFPIPDTPQDFVEGLTTICGNGDARLQTGIAMHVYLANRAMEDRYFSCSDGELLVLPQEGSLRVFTEFGIIDASPGEFFIVPRGVKFRVQIDGPSRGFVCENYGVPFRLPELGPIGANGLAGSMDFQVPTAAYEDREGRMEFVQKFAGKFWSCSLDYSPLDVVAWRGSVTPVKFNMHDFITMGAVSYDHADPSIFTALTSPSDPVLGANVDLLVVVPQWLAVEDTFRGAPFHRNIAFEFAAMIEGNSPNKSGGSGPGSMHIHNSFAPHGPDPGTHDRLVSRDPAPFRLEGMLFVAMEGRLPLTITDLAMHAPGFPESYADFWSGFRTLRRFA